MDNLTGDSLKRQTEINSWYYNYRLDTLFVLQLLFLGLSVIVLMSILSRYRIIPTIFVIYFAVFIILSVFFVWYYKYTYNKNTRDFYHWDKRRFAKDGAEVPALTPEVRAAMAQIMPTCNK